MALTKRIYEGTQKVRRCQIDGIDKKHLLSISSPATKKPKKMKLYR